MTNEKEFEDKLKNLGARIDALVEKSKDKFHDESDDLKKGWGLLQARQKSFTTDAKEKWEDVKQGMDESLDNVQKMYDNLKKKAGE